jgi:hypothetical protein
LSTPVDVKPNSLRNLQYTKSVADFNVLLVVIINFNIAYHGSCDSAVGIATRYGPDGPAIESRWRGYFSYPSRPSLSPIQPPLQCVPGSFPWSKANGAWRWPPTQSSAEFERKSRAITLLPFWSFVACSRVNCTFTFNIAYHTLPLPDTNQPLLDLKEVPLNFSIVEIQADLKSQENIQRTFLQTLNSVSVTMHCNLPKQLSIPALSSDHNPVDFKNVLRPSVFETRQIFDYVQADWSLYQPILGQLIFINPCPDLECTVQGFPLQGCMLHLQPIVRLSVRCHRLIFLLAWLLSPNSKLFPPTI